MSNKNERTAQHDAIRAAMRDLVVVPLDLKKPGLRILDSGTGDGYWLQDLLVQHPELAQPELIGTDATDANFPTSGLDASISLQKQSITAPWPEAWHKSFDLLHQRLVLGACGGFPFDQAVKNLVELVKPGGWIQLIEPDQTCDITDGPAMRDFLTLVTWVFENMDGHTRYAYSVKEYLQNAGVVNVQEYSIALFLGAKNADPELAARTARSTADAMIPLQKYTEMKKGALPLPQGRIDDIVPRLYDELIKIGGSYPIRVIFGQVPES